MAKKKSKKGKYKKARKIVLGVLAAYVLILGLVYAGGVFYYSKHFYSGSKINGFNCAGKTVKEVEKILRAKLRPMNWLFRNEKIRRKQLVQRRLVWSM